MAINRTNRSSLPCVSRRVGRASSLVSAMPKLSLPSCLPSTRVRDTAKTLDLPFSSFSLCAHPPGLGCILPPNIQEDRRCRKCGQKRIVLRQPANQRVGRAPRRSIPPPACFIGRFPSTVAKRHEERSVGDCLWSSRLNARIVTTRRNSLCRNTTLSVHEIKWSSLTVTVSGLVTDRTGWPG